MKKLILFAVMTLLMSGMTAVAQTLKFGHIDSGALIQMMPQTKQADSTLKRYAESLDAQLKGMTAEYQSKLQSYQSKADSLPDAIRAVKEKELSDLGQRIQDFQQNAQESIQSKKQELYGPIFKKAEDAIKEIAKEKAFSYIFDTSLGTVLFAQDSDDIMSLVKAKLGLK
ncbi:MAG: OmpH family outer membrane protein [Bacteroidetes bacterium]|nr:OmpH family outer membrane protein [Bacteroidota bacterium]